MGLSIFTAREINDQVHVGLRYFNKFLKIYFAHVFGLGGQSDHYFQFLVKILYSRKEGIVTKIKIIKPFFKPEIGFTLHEEKA